MNDEQDLPGLRSRSLTWAQALAMFFLILIIGLSLSFVLERQQQRLEDAQDQITANAATIRKTQVDGCYGGVAYVKRTNEQYQSLADIERSLLTDPDSTALQKRIALKRIKVYQGLLTELPPEPICPPR